METSEPMWVNLILNIIGVNSVRLGGLHISIDENFMSSKLCLFQVNALQKVT